MFEHSESRLEAVHTPGERVEALENDAWQLTMSAGQTGVYRLAQLDDYRGLSRRELPWRAPLKLSLEAKISSPLVLGTWGFGLWNDPFSAGLGFGGGVRKLPALPNTAWFFFASPENHLSLRDDLAAHGALAAVFRSPVWPWPLLSLSALAFPLLIWRPTARVFRRLAARVVEQDATQLTLDTTVWHRYDLEWNLSRVIFYIDGQPVGTARAPRGPLGLVLWIDNQFAALPPGGGLRQGSLATPFPVQLDIRNFGIESSS
jgi:hypothetical protein